MFPDGRRFVSGAGDETLKVWDVATGKCVATLEGHSARVRCGFRCTFVLMRLRRRSLALLYLRMGGASWYKAAFRITPRADEPWTLAADCDGATAFEFTPLRRRADPEGRDF